MDKNESPSSQNVKSSSSEALNKEGNPLSAKKSNQTEQEAANKAFNALFSGSRSQKTPVTTAIVAKAAPWPSVNHVQQKPMVGCVLATNGENERSSQAGR